MRIAIVESGGKQYRAVEGSTIDVDRLAHEVGKKFDFARVLLLADGDDIMVGTPTVGDIIVSATVVDHVKGPKVTSFKYRPKKRIRVKGGHRHFYTRLMIDFIGKAGEERKTAKKESVAKVEKAEVKEEPKVDKLAKVPAKTAEKKPAKKAEKAPAKKSSTTTKSASKSSATKKTEKKK
ncbi:MAG TPA: 50S ribosomal protein L21 [Anaerolineales bacterium]|nr:50S ribosomal protein L21 [Anaerolineales bacterium]